VGVWGVSPVAPPPPPSLSCCPFSPRRCSCWGWLEEEEAEEEGYSDERMLVHLARAHAKMAISCVLNDHKGSPASPPPSPSPSEDRLHGDASIPHARRAM
jgi:hypothetical protein